MIHLHFQSCPGLGLVAPRAGVGHGRPPPPPPASAAPGRRRLGMSCPQGWVWLLPEDEQAFIATRLAGNDPVQGTEAPGAAVFL